MEEWKEYRLGDIAVVTMGQSPNSSYYNNVGDGVPFLQGNRTFGMKYPTFDTFTTSATKYAEGNDVIMSVRAPVGDVNITPIRMCLGRGLCGLRLNNGNQEFLYYLMRYYANNLINKESGTVFGSINRNDIANLIVRVPSFELQKKIAYILSSFDDKIEVNQRINDNLEQQATALFKYWFVDFGPFKDGEFEESVLGMIPKGWRVGKLLDVANITMGTSPVGSSYNVTGEGDVFYQGRAEFGFRFPKRNMYTTEAKRFADIDSVLLSVRAPVGDINVADERCCIGRGLASIQSRDGNNSYILYLMKSLYPQFEKYNSEGTVFGCINKKALEQLAVVTPPNETISRFDKICSEIDGQIKILDQETRRLATLRDTLLPRLMSGKLKVNEL
ncbi:MAG: restriction endonuclease subunit S [Bacteroidales bacterium]|nr:restriction endonuclease subunit S [Bacteroidales bacterium]